MFHEPTKGQLQAQAGWTLLKRAETTPEHVVALDKYREGCESLIPFAPAAGDSGVVREAPPAAPRPAVAAERPDIGDFARQAMAVQGVVSCGDGGKHSFNIHDQRCVFCGQTRFQVLGRKPELMVQ